MISAVFYFHGAREAQLRLQNFGDKILSRLSPELHALTEELLQAVEEREPVRTGRLRAQTRARYRESDTRISGTIRPATRRLDAIKAAALEYGAHGTATVRQYERVSGAMVAAYNRRVNITAMRFLRDPWAEFQPEVESRLQRIVDSAVEEANR